MSCRVIEITEVASSDVWMMRERNGKRMGVKLKVWGDYALFTRPELKTERYTYDVMTPSAARGILESIYWHPGLRWYVDKIHVLNPIATTSVRRNELLSKIPKSNMLQAYNGGDVKLYNSSRDDIIQRASVILRDVSYVIEAHFEMTDKASPTDSPAKFISIFNNRARKGACYSMPYFGVREFPAHFKLCEGDEKIASCHEGLPDRDFGLMLYDLDYSCGRDIQPMYYHAVMKNGIIDVGNSEVLR